VWGRGRTKERERESICIYLTNLVRQVLGALFFKERNRNQRFITCTLTFLGSHLVRLAPESNPQFSEHIQTFCYALFP
jgi:EamA domain-containing membrane protein RarD